MIMMFQQIKKEQKLKEQKPEKKGWFQKNVEGAEQYEQWKNRRIKKKNTGKKEK